MNESTYSKKLDIVRILSCILVLLYHLNIIQGGFFAVCTFFVITGYLHTSSAMKDFNIKEYYIKRFKRIYIPLIVVVFVTVIFSKLIGDTRWINLKQETFSVIFGVNNFWQINANLDYFTRHINSPFMHFWYISILIQFEIIFPLLFLLFRKIDEKINKHISTIIVAVFMIAATVSFFVMSCTQEITLVYYNTFARSFSCLFGVMLAILHSKYEINIAEIIVNKVKSLGGLIFLFYCIILGIICIFINVESILYVPCMILVTIISTRLIEYATVEKGEKKDTNFLIIMFAKISYEVYLVQYPIIFFVQRFAIPEYLKFIIIIIAIFVVSFVLDIILNIDKNKKVIQIIRNVIIGLIVIIGSFIVLIEQDYTVEMNELKNILDDSQKMADERNSEFLNAETVETVILDAEPEEEISEEKLKEQITNMPIIGIGDSVMFTALTDLYNVFPNGYFDGKISRNINAGRKAIEELKEQGKLGDVLIIALANNGDYSNKNIDKFMEVVGNRKIYWIDAVNADDPTYNEKFRQYASQKYPNVKILEWSVCSNGHDEYFYKDGIHLKPTGGKAYANFIYEEIYKDYLKELNDKMIKDSSKKVDIVNVR